jgi:hypothetical protein
MLVMLASAKARNSEGTLFSFLTSFTFMPFIIVLPISHICWKGIRHFIAENIAFIRVYHLSTFCKRAPIIIPKYLIKLNH